MTADTNPSTPKHVDEGETALRLASIEAPFIYFDHAPTFGTQSGAIQVELAARIIAPAQGGTRNDFVLTAHLRCSPNAALELRNAIDKALGMLNLLGAPAATETKN